MIYDFQCLHGSNTPHCHCTIDKHFEDYYTLQLITRGKVDLQYDNEAHTLGPGSFWTAYPGPRIKFKAHGGSKEWHHHYIAIKGSIVQRWVTLGIFPYKPVHLEDYQQWAEHFDQVIKWGTSTTRFDAMKAANGLEALFIHLSQNQQVNTEPKWLSPLLSILESSNYQAIDYELVARTCTMALSTLRRKFKKFMGESLHTYIMRKRIDKACHLLRDGNLTLENIAQDLQYSDVHFFARQFKQIQGMTPGQFRKSLL